MCFFQRKKSNVNANEFSSLETQNHFGRRHRDGRSPVRRTFTTSGTHAFEIGDLVMRKNIVGAVEANVQGVVSSVSGTASFRLENTPGVVTAYVSGGTVSHLGWCSPGVNTDNSIFDESGTPPADYTIKVRLNNWSAWRQRKNCDRRRKLTAVYSPQRSSCDDVQSIRRDEDVDGRQYPPSPRISNAGPKN